MPFYILSLYSMATKFEHHGWWQIFLLKSVFWNKIWNLPFWTRTEHYIKPMNAFGISVSWPKWSQMVKNISKNCTHQPQTKTNQTLKNPVLILQLQMGWNGHGLNLSKGNLFVEPFFKQHCEYIHIAISPIKLPHNNESQCMSQCTIFIFVGKFWKQ